MNIENWGCRLKDYRQIVDINATVDADSPFWAGMTPILIAAKFDHIELVQQLLNFGALCNDRDSGGNTALHYIISQNPIAYDIDGIDEVLYNEVSKNYSSWMEVILLVHT